MEESTKNGRVNYIFIDYENVQPSSFDFPSEYNFKVLLFVGTNQTKIPIDLVISMQLMGANADYVKIAGNGKNALDFHIAYYLGSMLEKYPEGYFHIISKDSGFDVLVKYLRAKNVLIQRHIQIADIPALKISSSKTSKEKIGIIVNHLEKRGNAKPRKVATLSNTINSLFLTELSEKELKMLINKLVQQNYIKIEATKVHYTLNDGKL